MASHSSSESRSASLESPTASAGQLQSPTRALPTRSSSPFGSRSSPASGRGSGAARRKGKNHRISPRKVFQETIQHWRKAGFTIEKFLQAWVEEDLYTGTLARRSRVKRLRDAILKDPVLLHAVGLDRDSLI